MTVVRRRMLARGCDVVTLEIEQISERSLEAAANFAPVRPGRAMVTMIQSRVEQKNWLRRNGFPLGEFRAVRTLDELRTAIVETWAGAASARALVVATTAVVKGRSGSRTARTLRRRFGERGRLSAKVRAWWRKRSISSGRSASWWRGVLPAR